MEAGVDHDDHHAETEMVAELARQPGSGILGIISSIRPENAPGFDAWVEEGRDLGVVGYRRMLHVVPDDVSRTRDLPRQHPQARRRAGCRSTCASSPASFPIALELARACQDTQLVLDHCGNPDIAAGAVEPVARRPRRARRDAERRRQALRRLRQRRAGHRDPSRPSGPMSSR